MVLDPDSRTTREASNPTAPNGPRSSLCCHAAAALWSLHFSRSAAPFPSLVYCFPLYPLFFSSPRNFLSRITVQLRVELISHLRSSARSASHLASTVNSLVSFSFFKMVSFTSLLFAGSLPFVVLANHHHQQFRRSVVPSSESDMVKRHPGVNHSVHKMEKKNKHHRRSNDGPRRQGWRKGGSGGKPPGNGNGGSSGAAASSSSSTNEIQTSYSEAASTAAVEAAVAAKSTQTSTSSSSTATATSSSSSTYSGEATYFYQNGVAGACGTVHADTDLVVAIQSEMYSSANCGKSLTITNTASGTSVTAVAADECPSCVSAQSIDLSVAAFEALGSLDTGVLTVSWHWD